MIQASHLSTTPTKPLQASTVESYTYKEAIVKIITIFNDGDTSIALVENEGGELFEVPKNSLIAN